MFQIGAFQSNAFQVYLSAAVVAVPQETGKGWPKSRKDRRKEKRQQRLEEKQRFTGISWEVAKAEQERIARERAKPVAAPIPAPVIAPEPVEVKSDFRVTDIEAILAAWDRVEARQQAEQQEVARVVAAAEIARIQALKEEELMIVTMIAALV